MAAKAPSKPAPKSLFRSSKNKKKNKDDPPPELGEGSKMVSLPQFVSRHVELIDEQSGAIRVWFSSNNLKVSKQS